MITSTVRTMKLSADLKLFLIALLLAAGLLGAHVSAADSLYQDLGERANIVKFVDTATDEWLADDRIKDTFDNLNIERFKGRLVDQICEITGGPCKYKGRNMYLSHKGLHLDTAQFNALVEGLQDGMDRAGVPFRTQNRLLVLLAPMKRDIVTR